MTSLKWLVISLGVLLVLGMSTIFFGLRRWGKSTKAMLAQLEAARTPSSMLTMPDLYDERELEGLPASVQRYFRKVLKDGQPIITAVSLEQMGTFNMSETAQAWKPFTANQRVITQRPGFDWDARIQVLPFVAAHIHDAYIAGHGTLRGAILGLIPVVNMPDSPQLQQGEFMRYFMEALWYPTALLPSQGVRWEAVDAQSARATLKDGEISLTLNFQFQADGLIESARAQSRGRLVNGIPGAMPWHGRFWNYAIRDGMWIPLEADVAWVTPEGMKPYYRGKVTTISFEF